MNAIQTKAQKQQTTQTVYSQDIFDQIMSDAGYQGFRVKLDEFEDEFVCWDLQSYTDGWGWNTIDSLGFKQGQVTFYKTLNGALKRIKKEIDERNSWKR